MALDLTRIVRNEFFVSTGPVIVIIIVSIRLIATLVLIIIPICIYIYNPFPQDPLSSHSNHYVHMDISLHYTCISHHDRLSHCYLIGCSPTSKSRNNINSNNNNHHPLYSSFYCHDFPLCHISISL